MLRICSRIIRWGWDFIRWGWDFIRWGWGFIRGKDIPDCSDDGANGIGHSISISLFIGLQVAAFIIAIGKNEVDWTLIPGFCIVVVISLVMFLRLIRATKSEKVQEHYFDYATVLYTKWMASIMVSITGTVVVYALLNLLPGQDSGILPIKTVHIRSDEKGEYLEVHVIFGPDQFGGRLPDKHVLTFEFLDDLQDKWKHGLHGGFIGTPDIPMVTDPNVPDGHQAEDPTADVVLRDLRPDATYTLVFRLRKRNTEASSTEMKRLIEMEGKIEVRTTKSD